jgi:hypothetical protein
MNNTHSLVQRHNLARIIKIALGTAALVAMSQSAMAEAVLNPNQLVGDIEFTNQNPQVIDILTNQGAGLSSAYVRADSIGISPALNNYAFPPAVSPLKVSYQLTVESSETGVPYNVSAYARLDNNGENYMIPVSASSAVFPEPAADVRHDMKQCAGIVDVQFVDSEGQPAAINGGNIRGFQERSPGSGSFQLQAQDYALSQGITHEYLTVHGNGAKYKIDSLIHAGSDPYSDLVKFQCTREVVVSCDQVVIVTCPLSGTAAPLGAIDGQVDVVGEVENVTQSFTRMAAWYGPLTNTRFDKVDTGSGPFNLINLVPSSMDNDKGYTVYGELSLRTGYQAQYLRTPYRDPWYNGDVKVIAGETTHLDDTFVLKPGYVKGQIKLVGSSSLADLTRDADYDYNNDNLPDNQTMSHSVVQARGSNAIATGATMSSWGGWAKGGFTGAFDESTDAFNGAYELVLGGLHGEASVWSPNQLILRFDDRKTPDVPETYQYSWMQITDRLQRNKIIEPGSVTQVNHEYCLNEVQLQFKTLSGTIFSPSTRVLGHFEGEDFQGQMRNLSFDVNYANGTPRYQHEASATGLVVMNLPQGEHTITPKVRAVNPDGTTSYSELREVTMSVGCQQKVVISTDLQLQINEHPAEVETNTVQISGSVNSDGIVSSIEYFNNGVGPIVICENCEMDASFSVEVGLNLGDNQLDFHAMDEFGNESSVSTKVTLVEPEPVYDPLSFVTCPAIETTLDAIGTGTEVSYSLSAQGGCGDVQVSCSPASGSFFGVGSSTVSCIASDACSNQASCEFSVTINQAPEEPPVEEDNQQPIDEEPIEEEPVEEDCINGDVSMASSIGTQMMWPPNHELTNVGHSVSHSCEDPSTEVSEVAIATQVWSDEPENPSKKDGSGNFAPDAKGLDSQLRLRAERSGKGDGRVYLVISSDEVNNFSCSVAGTPKSQSKKDTKSLTEQMQDALTYCQANGVAPAFFFQHGMSEEVGPKQ